MDIDLSVGLAGLAVGFIVGLTGMGGGALMTPVLVLVFGVQPLAAVSSDLVASFVMKPVGGVVHWRRGTVNANLVRWLVAGSVPAAFAGVLILKGLGDGATVQERMKTMLGVTLLVAATAMVARAMLQARRARQHEPLPGSLDGSPLAVRRTATLAIGVIGGLIVGLTSVGSGSLIIVMLLLLYPSMRASELVGTDLVQAVPLVGSAALGHLIFGDFSLDLTTSLLIGSLPGVYLGARVSSRANDAVVRPVLVFVLLASSLKLLGVGTVALGVVMLAGVLVSLPVWGVLDAMARPKEQWDAAGHGKRRWVVSQAVTAPLGIGSTVALFYLCSVRAKLSAAGANA
ncbi:MAG: sulfite exporter TauE/SafE family protein [Actinomycetota bacterium]|nr:sulfite exporter TauE/SafE family protein [Actinomycetota bacterium]